MTRTSAGSTSAARVASRSSVVALLAIAAVATLSVVAAVADPAPGSPAASDAAMSPSASGSVASPKASTMPANVLITCGRDAFAGLGIDAPADAEALDTPEGQVLRATLRRYGDDFEGVTGWRVAGRTDSAVLFLGLDPDTEPPTWASIVVERAGEGWELGRWGGCEPRILIAPDLGPADWWLDPSSPAPGPDATQLQALVLETRCSGGSSAEGRIAEPVIVTTPTTVTITFGVHPVEGDVGCPANQPTPYTITLPEPLGDRQLLDGGRAPARQPTPIEIVEE